MVSQQPSRALNRSQKGGRGSTKIPVLALGFLLGCVTSGTLLLNFISTNQNNNIHQVPGGNAQEQVIQDGENVGVNAIQLAERDPFLRPLQGIRILIAIAAYDFSQLPHLEEVIDAYQDLCVSGPSKVDVVIHATIPYPVTLIDLWNSRLNPSCKDVFSLSIILKPSSIRLHLVDCHRPMFYEKINDYDLFIYTEDDIRVSPRTVAAYLYETAQVQKVVGRTRASDFNVGIVRYEYNYPSNVIIDDKTRHATQNVTRVYWEHGRYALNWCLSLYFRSFSFFSFVCLSSDTLSFPRRSLLFPPKNSRILTCTCEITTKGCFWQLQSYCLHGRIEKIVSLTRFEIVQE